MNNFNEMIGKMTEFLKSESKTETIIGEQFKLGEFTCVPVMSIGLGFGGGAGEGNGTAMEKGAGERNGIGGAAGLGMGPVGFLVTRNDEIQFISARTSKGLSAAFEKLPDLIEKFMKKKEEEKV